MTAMALAGRRGGREAGRSLFRHSGWDALLVLLAAAQGALLVLLAPPAPVIAVLVWWNSNTISHYFIHQPFFRPRPLNLLFSFYLTALLGIPQSLWRARHLAHHAGTKPVLRWSGVLFAELILIGGVWTALLALAPGFFLAAYLPGLLGGLLIGWLHGHYEHAGGTTSHYGRLYNFLFLNDGYHLEHHARPGLHWRRLRGGRDQGARGSSWPAPLRWLERFDLEALERVVLRSGLLQRIVLRAHQQALERILEGQPRPRRVGIVGGGLFPRTALALGRLVPGARLTLIDLSAANVEVARRLLDGVVETLVERYDPRLHGGFDLLVFPLSYSGDRGDLYAQPPAPAVIVHDWIWRRRGRSAVVSPWLLKRVNLVKP